MEKEYLKLAQTILEKGTYKPAARKGLPGTTSLFGYQMRHDLSEGFPLLTTKKVSFKNVLVELL
jgi:thymidylate synthase